MNVMILRIWNDADAEYWSAHYDYRTLEEHLLSYVHENGNHEDFEGLSPGEAISKFFDIMEDTSWYEVKTVPLVGFQNNPPPAPDADTVFLTERELVIARRAMELVNPGRMQKELALPGQSAQNVNKEIVNVYKKLA